jgi:hypothetical protein
MRKPEDFEGCANSSIEASIAAAELVEEALFPGTALMERH